MAITPELIRTLLTGIPVLLGAWWLVIATGALWRRTVWRQVGAEVREIASRWRVSPTATWTGFRVAQGENEVIWHGGLGGSRTVLRHAGSRRVETRWLDADAVERGLGMERPPV